MPIENPESCHACGGSPRMFNEIAESKRQLWLEAAKFRGALKTLVFAYKHGGIGPDNIAAAERVLRENNKCQVRYTGLPEDALVEDYTDDECDTKAGGGDE